MKRILILLGIFLFLDICSSADARAKQFETIDSLNDAVAKVDGVVSRLQELNGEAMRLKLANLKSNYNDADWAVIARDVKYPTELKETFDINSRRIVELGSSLINPFDEYSLLESCKNEMVAIKPRFEALKSAVLKASQYSIEDDASRAKSYMAAIEFMPMTIIIADLVLVQMTDCNPAFNKL
ncbi:hypothetical protein [Aliikangiella sp. G2MR2-5]|uniref:hypothetical protein n=1 Tax=Aliikangiella sp. G2MR2-5 TaxID=2788943 RepID=UPI0018AB9857|nr:hypothetical protein [Aliikangiella sp. G2MR2-5]